METAKAISERKSTRAFLTNREVPKETVQELLNLAKQAPSWVNSQPEHVYAVSGKKLAELRKAYKAASQAGKKGAPDIPVKSRAEWAEQGRSNMKEWNDNLPKVLGENWSEIMGEHSDALYNVPNLLILTLPKGYSDWSLYDLGAFGQNFITAATDKGLATMTAYQFIKYPKILRKVLNIPDDEVVIIGIGLGYADQNDQMNKITSTRMPLEEFVTFEN
jgi:nitroreductase